MLIRHWLIFLKEDRHLESAPSKSLGPVICHCQEQPVEVPKAQMPANSANGQHRPVQQKRGRHSYFESLCLFRRGPSDGEALRPAEPRTLAKTSVVQSTHCSNYRSRVEVAAVSAGLTRTARPRCALLRRAFHPCHMFCRRRSIDRASYGFVATIV